MGISKSIPFYLNELKAGFDRTSTRVLGIISTRWDVSQFMLSKNLPFDLTRIKNRRIKTQRNSKF